MSICKLRLRFRRTLYSFQILFPIRHKHFDILLWWVRLGVVRLSSGCIYLSKYIWVKNQCFFTFFFNFFKLIGGTILIFFFMNNVPKIQLVGRQWIRKSTLFAKQTSEIWPFWGVKKSFSVCIFLNMSSIFFFFMVMCNVLSYHGERF